MTLRYRAVIAAERAAVGMQDFLRRATSASWQLATNHLLYKIVASGILLLDREYNFKSAIFDAFRLSALLLRVRCLTILRCLTSNRIVSGPLLHEHPLILNQVCGESRNVSWTSDLNISLRLLSCNHS